MASSVFNAERGRGSANTVAKVNVRAKGIEENDEREESPD